MKWWLVEDEVATEVIRALNSANRCLGSSVVSTYRDALHSLESGLHQTDALPPDWMKPDAEGGAA